ncbi:helix-turn-helix domain-containing protein [Halomonas sp. M20]|uniref:helix-turn-helix domain-containing protein n=1 Tax=Halomonas sp. M20 TaxID=2763264 RepID=UPI001D0ACFC5|nr:helix-turn-helix domain-containing protein [Halomonas sp. M20]
MAQDRVEAVERALTILEAFDSSMESFTLAELANATGFYKSTLLRLLSSLERFDYVQRGSDGRYRLGSTPLRLARRHLPSRQLEVSIQPVLDRLAGVSGETASLIEIDDENAECRLVTTPDAALHHALRPGQRWPAPQGSPILDFIGGVMVCQRLTTADSGTLWLALSGPRGRLDPTTATALLNEAVSRVAQRPEATSPSAIAAP